MKASVVGVCLVFGLFVVSCYDDSPSSGQVFVCDPAGDDCGDSGVCVQAGMLWVCSSDRKCSPACRSPEVCVNGNCDCFPSCTGLECGDDGCGGSCGKCPAGESWSCIAGKCKDDCEGLECGESPRLGVDCGTCVGATMWCVNNACADDCAGRECGESPVLEVSCGTCPTGDTWLCDLGECKDDCAGLECGQSPVLGVSCGSCPSREWCNDGICADDCGSWECGVSEHGVSCGSCPLREWCNDGICADDCGSWECGVSEHGVSCGSCPLREWCNVGICAEDCGSAICGLSSHGVDCGDCEEGWLCVEGQCEDDCAGLECGKSPVLGVSCGSCPSREWCNDGTCEDDCGMTVCGLSAHGVDCGECSRGYECLLGECVEIGEMKLVASGSFWMGCNQTVDNECEPDERPYHKVTLSGYYMDKTEVTVNQYAECVTAEACTVPSTGGICNWGEANGNHPVNCVTWTQADDYCAWVGKRLPTEAEWEKAARGTDGRKYPWGNELATCAYAVMDDGGDGCGRFSTWSVCSKSPAGDSPYGVCDMAGNVSEWVSDWYGSEYYASSPASNPIGPDSGSDRVIRGGCLRYHNYLIRASGRYWYPPSAPWDYLGFRCAKDAP